MPTFTIRSWEFSTSSSFQSSCSGSPLTSVTFGLGYGFGSGSGADATGEGGSGSGGGGGGGGSVRPVAVLELNGQGARVVPVIDWNRVAFGVMALIGARGLFGLLLRR